VKIITNPILHGPEIQVLDNERHPDAKANPNFHQAGALYDMVQPSKMYVNLLENGIMCCSLLITTKMKEVLN